MQKRFRKTRDAYIKDRYREGMAPAQIARNADTSRQLVDHVVRQAGLHKPSAERRKDRNQAVLQDYGDGLTLSQVGIKHGLSTSRVFQIVHNAEVGCASLEEKGDDDGSEL